MRWTGGHREVDVAIVNAAGGKVSIKNFQADHRVDAQFTNNQIEQ